MSERRERREIHEILRRVRTIERLVRALSLNLPTPNSAIIQQIDSGGNIMAITGTIPGTTSTFEVDALLERRTGLGRLACGHCGYLDDR